MSHQYALSAQKTNCILDCMKRIVTSNWGRRFCLSTLLLWDPTWILCPVLGPQHKKNIGLLERSREEPQKIIWELEHLTCGEKVGIFSVEKRREPIRKRKRDFSQGYVVTAQGAFNLMEGKYTLDMRWSSGCPISRNIQIQVGWGLEQLALMEDVANHGTGFWITGWSSMLPSNTNHSMILVHFSLGN